MTKLECCFACRFRPAWFSPRCRAAPWPSTPALRLSLCRNLSRSRARRKAGVTPIDALLRPLVDISLHEFGHAVFECWGYQRSAARKTQPIRYRPTSCCTSERPRCADCVQDRVRSRNRAARAIDARRARRVFDKSWPPEPTRQVPGRPGSTQPAQPQ